jgi:putative flippase GtrA
MRLRLFRREWRWASLSTSIRYVGVGALCAILNNILLISIVKSGFDFFAGIWIAYLPMIFVGYGLHASITFEAKPSFAAFLRYGLAMLANYPLWIASLFVLCDIMKLPIIIAGPIGTVVTFSWNYLSTHWAILRSVRAALPWRVHPSGANPS